jgi:hypothetical protein
LISGLLSGHFPQKLPSLPLPSETLVFDPRENQIARIGSGGIASGNYYIIISGGGYYLVGRDKDAKRTWTCKGEGRFLSISEGSKRRFSISDGDQGIAEAKKAWLTEDYAIGIFDDADFKLVVCIFIALSLRENQRPGIEIVIGG